MSRLYLFVEGDDDERFISKIIIPFLEDKYECIQPIKYSQHSPVTQCKLIRSILSQGNQLSYLRDFDSNVCVSHKKEEIRKQLREVPEDNIIIVKNEIESWYFAGSTLRELNKPLRMYKKSTELLTKEELLAVRPERFLSNQDFYTEILKGFSLERAIKRNKSLRYMVAKYSS